MVFHDSPSKQRRRKAKALSVPSNPAQRQGIAQRKGERIDRREQNAPVPQKEQPLAAPQPAQLYLIDATTPKSALLRTLRAGRASLYLRRDTGRLITDRALLRQLAREEGR